MKLFEIKQTQPKWMTVSLNESKERKNTHLEHLEDLVFNEGYAGAVKALNYLNSLRKMFNRGQGEKTKITVKWDGAPAIVCGIDPEDGKFFVGTKSVFAKTDPKVCKSGADIKRFYPEQEELRNKLMTALKYLKKLNIGEVVQGDMLFTEDSVATEVINGDTCYTFTPNTITYAVPVDSDLGKRIAKAKIGIIFHTTYVGSTLWYMEVDFKASIPRFTQTPDVWFDDATYKDFTGYASLTKEENSKIVSVLSAAKKTMEKIKQPKFDSAMENPEFKKYVKTFINSQIRTGVQVGDPTKFLNDFIEYYRGRIEAEIAKLKSGPESVAAQRKKQLITDFEEFISDHSNHILGILAIYKRIIEGKIMIINKMRQVESVGTFLKTDDGYRVTAPEGFVAVGHDGGAVKLVDRIEFSKANFTQPKNWGKK